MEQMLLREKVSLILDCLREYSYSGEYINTFRRRLNQVVEHYTAMGIIHYTPGQYEKYLFHITDEYANGRLRLDLFWAYRKCAYYLDEYCRLGYVEPKMLVQESCHVLRGIFKESLDAYLSSLSPQIKDSTIAQRRYAIQKHLYRLQELGHQSYESIKAHDIQGYFMHLSTELSNKSLNQNRLHIRQFYIYLSENGLFTPNWASFLDFKIVVPEKIQGYLTTEEIDAILSQVRTDTNTGKRDYAIISLARTTGLRGCDIINLNLTDIDWTLGSITVCQQKTGVNIQLPLLTESGEALKEYILYGRPKTDCPKIFVRAQAPYTALRSTASLDALLRKYQKCTNCTSYPWDGKAFHGTRRGLGRDLVRAGVPVTSIMQILGHSHMDSSKPYMMLNTSELKECALDFANIPVERGELT